jgi:uncharacterized protein (TIGR02996 family)
VPTEAGFVEAIVTRRGDDAPRLIFADWLEEHGAAERAEFIRVQCELARLECVLSSPFPDQAECTGASANWCPVCGDCCCPRPEDAKNDPRCPLHAPMSRHGDDDSVNALAKDLRGRERKILHGPARIDLAGADAPFALRPPVDAAALDFAWVLGGPATARATFRRGFVAALECAAEDFFRRADALLWCWGECRTCPRPAQTSCSHCHGKGRVPPTMECPTCEGRGQYEPAFSDGGSPKDHSCEHCAGSGRVPRPCPATAQPIEQVELTTVPHIEQDANRVWFPGRRKWDKWDDRFGGAGAYLPPRLLAAEWPGVRFKLPGDPPFRAAGPRPAGRRGGGA